MRVRTHLIAKLERSAFAPPAKGRRYYIESISGWLYHRHIGFRSRRRDAQDDFCVADECGLQIVLRLPLGLSPSHCGESSRLKRRIKERNSLSILSRTTRRPNFQSQ